MSETIVKMDTFGGSLQVAVQLWSVLENRYRWTHLTFDTGASVTTISPEILARLGYKPLEKAKVSLTTASSIEYVPSYKLDKFKIGVIELHNVDVYGHSFPEECFSIGVIGLNILQCFDIELLFSKKIIKLRQLY
ncbi:MAG: retroviral-like aspartic protease family protein [Defluviitaleaceae bacterium]|nr:retroviral-like aspartic protease family protein [Defluviitaleaceae bacterium]